MTEQTVTDQATTDQAKRAELAMGSFALGSVSVTRGLLNLILPLVFFRKALADE